MPIFSFNGFVLILIVAYFAARLINRGKPGFLKDYLLTLTGVATLVTMLNVFLISFDTVNIVLFIVSVGLFFYFLNRKIHKK